MRRLARFGLALWLCVGCRAPAAQPATDHQAAPPSAERAPERGQPSKRHPPAGSAVSEGFSPPDAQGWGRAAGLRYLELLAGGARAEQRVPMLVMLHGLGDRAHGGWFGEFELPVRIVLPQAPMPYGAGYAWFDYRVADQDPVELARGIAKASDQLARALALLTKGRPTAGLPVVSGFSQGGMLSYALALHHPEVLEVALPVSGMLPRPLWPLQRAPGARSPAIVGLHGTSDSIVPIASARALIEHLGELGHRAELREFVGVRHHVSPAMQELLTELATDGLRRASKQL